MINSEETDRQLLTLKLLKDQIPPSCFEKKLLHSLFYMFRDMLLISTCFFTYDYFSSTWLGLFVYWNIYGFLMWCLFVVGHDCGHDTFSKYPLLNAICGHLCHTPLFVPFFPWAYSHRKHHQFHNHLNKDNSHPWFTEEQMKASIGKRIFLRTILAPFLGYGVYLYVGLFDGSHINPKGKLFRDSKREAAKCVISTFFILSFAISLFMIFPSWSSFMLFYGGPWIVFSFWLFMVTYMQHHDEETVVYDDSNWEFLTSALETNDSKFGFGIDNFHHNITDCHLVHHLFFSNIPHYHLRKATNAITPILKNKYRFKNHNFFLKDFWKLFFTVNFTKWKIHK